MAISAATKWVDNRLGTSKIGPKQLSKVFPDHWSFMLGEITLYCFVILLVTGSYLTFFFEPSAREVVYEGSYAPMFGKEMSAAYASSLDISFDTKFGLVMRQMHHWSALLFLAAMVVHMFRVFFTGAYRRPRELNWVIGINLLILAIFNGFLGYSLLDDLLSGTGVRVGYSILLSIPVVGTYLANIVFGGPFPDPILIPRFFVLHVLLLPAAIVGLMSAHLGLVWYNKHTQFPGPGRTENNVIGTPLFPAYMFKMVGLFFFVVAVCGFLGGVVQINAIWKYGPYYGEGVVAAVSSASQPDWYMGWLDGVLRLIPGWETRIWGFYIPNYFWGGIVLPGIVFTVAMMWPFLEPKWTKDTKAHNLLQRPRDTPGRTAFGAAMFAFFFVLLLAGSNDVLATIFFVAPETITLWFRVLVFVLPVFIFWLTRKICLELQNTSSHPAVPGPNHVVIRTSDGGYSMSHGDHGDHHHNGEPHTNGHVTERRDEEGHIIEGHANGSGSHRGAAPSEPEH